MSEYMEYGIMGKERKSLTQAIEKVAERIVQEQEENSDEKLLKAKEKSVKQAPEAK